MHQSLAPADLEDSLQNPGLAIDQALSPADLEDSLKNPGFAMYHAMNQEQEAAEGTYA